MIDPRAWLHRLRVRRRRRKLLDAYATVFRVRHDKGPGLSPLLAAYDMAERDGLLEVRDGEVEWHWPPDATDVDAGV